MGVAVTVLPATIVLVVILLRTMPAPRVTIVPMLPPPTSLAPRESIQLLLLRQLVLVVLPALSAPQQDRRAVHHVRLGRIAQQRA